MLFKESYIYHILFLTSFKKCFLGVSLDRIHVIELQSSYFIEIYRN